MNWKEISENCPKAFLEWVSSKVGRYVDSVKYCEEKEFYQKDDEHCFELPNCDFLWVSNDDAVCFPYYFDKFGICISVSYYIFSEDETDRFTSTSTLVEDYDLNKFVSNGLFPDRLSATAAGATKAFEIRDQQLNEAK